MENSSINQGITETDDPPDERDIPEENSSINQGITETVLTPSSLLLF